MKINECSVIDNKVIDVRLRILLEQIKLAKRNGGVKDLNELSEKVNDIIDIVNNLKPLEPIVKDAYFKEDYLNELTPADFNDYINENEI